MSDPPEIRVHWSVTLWGPQAADDPKHSVGGTGSTPDEALKALRENIERDADLVHNFKAEARSL